MIPPEYVGREQTWLKHRVLEEYLISWALKLGSVGGRRRVKLWFVDCFSGPWNSRTTDLSDTSIMIGLKALQAARATWADKGIAIELGAIFVEKDPAAFAELQRVVDAEARGIDAHALPGEFGDRVSQINALVGSDSAFFLIDPTGWDGAAMEFIAPLVSKPRRDVLVNVMFDHINRFKDDARAFLRAQMKDFFGLPESDLPAGLSEEQLLTFYRDRLRAVCGVPFTADLAVQHPTFERTKFRLVVGGHHREVLRLFRDIERKVMGEEAAVVRTEAKEQRRAARDPQLALIAPEPPKESPRYATQRDEGLRLARARLPELLQSGAWTRYDEVWPVVLAECHVTETDLAAIVGDLRGESIVEVRGLKPKEKRIKDTHSLRLLPSSP